MSYPSFDNKIPCSPTDRITDKKLDEIKWEVEDDIVKPDYSGPTPPDSFYCSETPVCINSD